MKIIIGCANFGNLYGLKKKILSQKKIDEIVKQAKKIGVNRFDTANDYGKSEYFLGKSIKKIYFNKKVFIDTKLPKKITLKGKNKNLEKIIRSSIKRLNINFINTLYIHDPNQLLQKDGKYFYEELIKAKKLKIIKKIGVSVYTTNEVKKILKKFKIDVIQVPYNILDTRFINSKLLNFLKKKKCILIARSIFLKGLLLKKNLETIKYFNKWHIIFKKMNFLLKKNNLSLKDWTLNHLNKNKNFKNFIIGVSDAKQLKEINAILNKKKKNDLAFFKLDVVSKRLINPKYWKIN